MIFDKLAMFAERHAPELIPMISEAAIFDFPAKAHEVLPKQWDDLNLVAASEFFLPLPTVAIEDLASCILLQDTEKNQVGLDGERRFIEIAHLGGSSEAYAVQAGWSEADRQSSQGKYMVAAGIISSIRPQQRSFQFYGALTQAFIFSKEGILFHINSREMALSGMLSEMKEATLRNVMTAIEEIHMVNQPRNFVVETAPISPRKAAKGRILRSPDRPIFSILELGEVQRLLGIREGGGAGQGGGRIPHPRRRHWRTLRSEYYTTRRGEKLLIPATWIGPEEARRGNRIIRVRLDL